ncbi:hypothetical protein A3K64_01820 [Candidatus Micrarchaeota archaeon RBG_16_36_9]|nr:MAG: hypothetical protein A3K64_01820 [Candidatus Micrarchaeota archaeon RBG_16_36_9]
MKNKESFNWKEFLKPKPLKIIVFLLLAFIGFLGILWAMSTWTLISSPTSIQDAFAHTFLYPFDTVNFIINKNSYVGSLANIPGSYFISPNPSDFNFFFLDIIWYYFIVSFSYYLCERIDRKYNKS